MSKKLYGSLFNRLEENKMYCEEIKEGTGVTEYLYSDRHAYEVVKVENQKHVFVREYDHKHIGDGNMDNNWELISNINNPIKELKFRYNKWNWVTKVSPNTDMAKMYIISPEVCKAINKAKETNKEQEVYHPTNVSFGTAQYYYDYEF